MDFMDLAVCCPRRPVKLDKSLTLFQSRELFICYILCIVNNGEVVRKQNPRDAKISGRCSMWYTFPHSADDDACIVFMSKLFIFNCLMIWIDILDAFFWIVITGPKPSKNVFCLLLLSKLRLCLSNHMPCYFINLACNWLCLVKACWEQGIENIVWWL